MKTVALFLLLALSLSAGPVVTCTPGNYVAVGQTLTCTSNVAVTWSLLTGSGGVATIGSSTSTSVTINAPSSIVPQQVMSGWQVGPDDDIFHTRIDNLPVTASSAAMVNAMTFGNPTGSTLNFGEMSWGEGICSASTPTINLNNFYGGSTSGFPIAPLPKGENGSYPFSSRMDNNDRHIMELCTDTGTFWDAYGIHNSTSPSGIECIGGSLGYCNSQASVSYKSTDYATNNGMSGVDAAGLPIAPLTLTLADIYSGTVKHAIRFTMGGGGINTGATCSAINSCNQSGAASPTLSGTQYMQFSIYGLTSGNSPLTTTESAVQQNTPGRQFTSAIIGIGSAPPTGQTVTVTLRDNGVSTGVNCTITGPATGCNVNVNYSIADNHLVDFQLVSSTSFSVPYIYILSYWQGYLWPGASQNGDSGYLCPVMGTRFRLRLCGVGGVSTRCVTPSSYTANQQVVLNGLNQYGIIVADNGTQLSITPSSDLSLDRTVMNDVINLTSTLQANYLDVVDESMLQLNNTYVTCPYNVSGLCAGGTTNSYEQPANQAVLVATASGSSTYTPIAIQAVAVRVGTW